MDFNGDNPGKIEYDKGCLSGVFTDSKLADERKAKICGEESKDCADQSSDWTFVFLFNGIIFAAMALNFLLLTVGSCNAHLRYISGIMFCLTGPAYFYAIYQTYNHSSMNEDHYSTICELNLGDSYHASGLMESFDVENVPRTFAEDSRLILALLLYQVSFLPMCLGAGLCPLFRFRPSRK